MEHASRFPERPEFEELRARVAKSLDNLSEPELNLMLVFIDQILSSFDPDIVSEFLAWKDDPNLDSILQIAAELDPEARVQLLFDAEFRLRSDSGIADVT